MFKSHLLYLGQKQPTKYRSTISFQFQVNSKQLMIYYCIEDIPLGQLLCLVYIWDYCYLFQVVFRCEILDAFQVLFEYVLESVSSQVLYILFIALILFYVKIEYIQFHLFLYQKLVFWCLLLLYNFLLSYRCLFQYLLLYLRLYLLFLSLFHVVLNLIQLTYLVIGISQSRISQKCIFLGLSLDYHRLFIDNQLVAVVQ